MITDSDREDTKGYIRTLTDSQVLGFIEKESASSCPDRKQYAQLGRDEAERRGIQ